MIVTISTTLTTTIIRMSLVVEAPHATTMDATEWTVVSPRIHMTAADRPIELIWTTHPICHLHDRVMMTIDTTIVIKVRISDTTLDIEVTLPDETISIGELPVSRQIAMLIIATIRVRETTLAHPRTHVMIVITIMSVIPIIGVTGVLPTTTLVMTTAQTDTTIGIGDTRIIVPAY